MAVLTPIPSVHRSLPAAARLEQTLYGENYSRGWAGLSAQFAEQLEERNQARVEQAFMPNHPERE